MPGEPREEFQAPPADALLDMHARLLEIHGGAPGVRDAGALDAALARPGNLVAYGGGAATLVQLAVCIAYSIVRIRHPFVDGNKRVAFAALVVVLDMNGVALDAEEAEAAAIMQQVASGDVSEEDFAEWVGCKILAAEEEG